MASINGVDAVIFGAPDRCSNVANRSPSQCTGFGNGYIFALNASTGALIWRSDAVALVNGLTPSDAHEQIGYSAPVVFNNHVAVGVADHVDNPIQRGKVVAVHLTTGSVDQSFSFVSTSSGPGGGVWSSVASDLRSLYVTTGNTNVGGSPPSIDHGHAMLKLDQNTGAVLWKYQPVAYSQDGDDDWATTPTVMFASCTTLAVSTQKDGWTHAVDTATGAARWRFPAGSLPNGSNGQGYRTPGAAWGDVYFAVAGGLTLPFFPGYGYGRLHALNACASDQFRVRWIFDNPELDGNGFPVALGPPSVTNGMVFVGTATGHLLVIADPRVAPSDGWRCSDPDVATAQCHGTIINCDFEGPRRPICIRTVLRLIHDPSLQANIDLGDPISPVVGEPALARGKVYVATGSFGLYPGGPGSWSSTVGTGRVFMLEP